MHKSVFVLHAERGEIKPDIKPDIKPLCTELKKKGSTAGDQPFFKMMMNPPYTIQAIYRRLENMEDALTYEDINLWLPNARLLDAKLFEQMARQHAVEGKPMQIEVCD